MDTSQSTLSARASDHILSASPGLASSRPECYFCSSEVLLLQLREQRARKYVRSRVKDDHLEQRKVDFAGRVWLRLLHHHPLHASRTSAGTIDNERSISRQV